MKIWQTEVEKVKLSNENMGQKMVQSLMTKRREDALNEMMMINALIKAKQEVQRRSYMSCIMGVFRVFVKQ